MQENCNFEIALKNATLKSTEQNMQKICKLFVLKSYVRTNQSAGI